MARSSDASVEGVPEAAPHLPDRLIALLEAAGGTGAAEVATAGFDLAIVAHGDLPLAEDLTVAAGFDGVTLVPDRHDDGTNVLAVPTGAGFVFHYGPGSFGLHLVSSHDSVAQK